MVILSLISIILGIISGIYVIGDYTLRVKNWHDKNTSQKNSPNIQIYNPSYQPPAQRKLKIFNKNVPLRRVITSVAILILIIAFGLFIRSQFIPQIFSGPNDIGFNSQIEALSWSPEQKRLAIASLDGVQLWNDSTDQSTTIPISGDQVSAIAWSPDGNFIAFGGRDTSLQIWNVTKGVSSSTIPMHSAGLNAIAWSPNGKLIAFGGDDSKVEVYNFITGMIVPEYPNTSSVTALSWSPDSNRLAFGDYGGEIHILDAATGKDIFEPFLASNGPILSLEWSPSNSLLASIGEMDTRIQIWDTTKNYPENQVNTINNSGGWWINGLAWSPQGSDIASVDFGGTLRIWDALSSENITSYFDTSECTRVNAVLSSVTWSSNGKSIAFGHNVEEGSIVGSSCSFYSVKVVSLCKSWCFIPSILQTLFGVAP